MPPPKRSRPRPPLDQAKLRELGLSYVGRFATTKAKLRSYLERKLRERGWDDQAAPDTEAVADHFARLGYIDDAAFALSKSRALSGRGYGPGRVRQSLRVAGVSDDDSAPARSAAEEQAVKAALTFAARRRIGPYSSEVADTRGRERALSAMVRAGHSFQLARAIVDLAPGASTDALDLEEQLGLIGH